MGMTQETLEQRVAQEIAEILRQESADRRLDRIMAGAFEEFPRVLSKEDCLALFTATGVPSSGSLYGVYRWAADLDMAKFNFEDEVVGDDYSFLNAYN
jgi:hypothetical protein